VRVSLGGARSQIVFAFARANRSRMQRSRVRFEALRIYLLVLRITAYGPLRRFAAMQQNARNGGEADAR
jgi:hypothetical protein